MYCGPAMKFLSGLLKRFGEAIHRRANRCGKRNDINWLMRYSKAHDKMWATFRRMPIEEKSLLWLERNDRRLQRLGERKFELITTRK